MLSTREYRYTSIPRLYSMVISCGYQRPIHERFKIFCVVSLDDCMEFCLVELLFNIHITVNVIETISFQFEKLEHRTRVAC